jgi:O-antigen ligase
VGTIYASNQAGIFLAAGALLAFGAVTGRRTTLAPLGWVVGPLAGAGVVFSASRGSQLGLVLGIALLLALAIVAGQRTGACRLLGAVAASGLVAYALSGPPFFAQRLSAIAATEEKAGSFLSNGVARLEGWRRALAIFHEWPVSGAGFYSYDDATDIATTKRGELVTAFAHNGFLQVLSDGGLVLALPVFAALAIVVVRAVRALPTSVRTAEFGQLTGSVTLLVLLLHSGMDFDWTYPGLLSLASLVAALALPLPEHRSGRADRSGTVLGLVAATLLTVSAVAAWNGGLDLNSPIPPDSTALIGD